MSEDDILQGNTVLQSKIRRAEYLFRCGYTVLQSELIDPHLPPDEYDKTEALLDALHIQLPHRWPFRERVFTIIDSILQKYTSLGLLTLAPTVSETAPDAGFGLPLGKLVDQVTEAGELQNAALLSVYALYQLLATLLDSGCRVVLQVGPFPSNVDTYKLLTNSLPQSTDNSWRSAPFYALGEELVQPLYLFDLRQSAALLDYANQQWPDCHVVVTSTQREADWLAQRQSIQTDQRPVILRADAAQPVAIISGWEDDGHVSLTDNEGLWGTDFVLDELEPMQYIPLQRFAYVGMRIIIYYSTTKPNDSVVAQLVRRCVGTLIILCVKS